jgi:hypothetical protein
MTRRKLQPAGRGVAPMLILWASLGAASGFLLWSLRVEAAGADALEASLRLYASSLLIGLLLSGIALACLRRHSSALGWVSYASGVVYLGFGTALGWSPLPAALAVSAAAVIVFGRARWVVAAEPPLLLAHVMGTVSGLYLFFHLREFLSAWPAFREVLAALWMLLSRSGAA